MYTWQEQALWLHSIMHYTEFTLAQPTICTVKLFFDGEGEHIHRLSCILRDLFGAWPSGPSWNRPDKQWQTATSFGFYNQELLDNARRVFPLPDGFLPGPPVYIGYTEAEVRSWESVRCAYDKHVSELPKKGTNYGV